jgi:S1-C subfamily serine protease
MKKSDAIIGGVSVLVLLIGFVVFLIMQSGAGEYRNMQGPVAIVTPGPATQRGTISPPPSVALGASIRGTDDGVLVQQVLPGSTGEAAGLQEGDVILAIDDARTLTPQRLMDILRKHQVDDEITLKIRRGQDASDLKVKLMSREAVMQLVPRRGLSTRP